jgi:hypothetical protein
MAVELKVLQQRAAGSSSSSSSAFSGWLSKQMQQGAMIPAVI